MPNNDTWRDQRVRRAALPTYVKCRCGALAVNERAGGVFRAGHSVDFCDDNDIGVRPSTPTA
jgi:hypothetical protein